MEFNRIFWANIQCSFSLQNQPEMSFNSQMEKKVYCTEFPPRRDKLPYTLLLKPQSGEYGQTVEVDLVPALMVANSKLPAKVRARLDHVQAGREIASSSPRHLAHYCTSVPIDRIL